MSSGADPTRSPFGMQLIEIMTGIIPDKIAEFLRQHDMGDVKYKPTINALDRPSWVASRLHFAGAHLDGFVELVVEPSVFAKALPGKAHETTDKTGKKKSVKHPLASDYVGELTNQLAARIFREFEKYRVEIVSECPKNIATPSFGKSCPIGELRLQIPYSTNSGDVHVFLQMRFEREVSLSRDDTKDLPKAGDIIIY